MLSLKTRIAIGFLLVAVYGVVAVSLALSLPASDIRFQVEDDTMVAVLADGSQRSLSHFHDGTRDIAASPRLMLEEPDVLASYADMNAFFDDHRSLQQALSDGTLSIVDTSGERLAVSPTQRTVQSLPGLFWLQLVCGLAGMIICLMVWVPARREIAIHSFALTGLSYVLFSSAAAIYSTRELFIPGPWFTVLSGINHFGALLFSASLAAFLWNYPRPAPSRWFTGMLYGLFVVAIGIDQWQLLATPAAGFHSWVMGIFLLGLGGALWQWRQTRGQPSHRVALRWTVLSIILGTAFFSGGMILPAMMNVAIPASQGLLFTTFLLMYLGMAMGVVRHRLFNLEPWWFSLWSWLLGGLMIMLMDLLLAMILTLSGPATLALSVALIGWLYFPVRQYVWGKLIRNNQPGLDSWLSQALPAMLQVRKINPQQSGIAEALDAVFSPLSLEQVSGVKPFAAIGDKGNQLIVPDPAGHHHFVLQHPGNGQRLFSRRDVDISKLVLSLHQLVNQTRTAWQDGASEERNRIRRDMHDDLGAKLLHLLHKSNPDSRPLVREAINDLRDLLREMEGHSLSLEAATSQWREETARRCKDHEVTLQWDETLLPVTLDASSFSEITRIVRESVSNALKHSATPVLRVTIKASTDQLDLIIINSGLNAAAEPGPQRGLNIMQTRARKMAGQFDYITVNGEWQVRLTVPLD
ncbi:sensor histidine kinase [Alcanivorax sp. S6407]|uniref:sensor histidine kinase n=1 Tax=Alcanivorax sp. S6407 TaxID=2926424 RepID=UPI001FF6F3A9|nr:sensor histidine kinase [Alcanivorax sp. S6407]MCK0155435.1 sensor histidine kinase [Alcanivorax sp. S6407]